MMVDIVDADEAPSLSRPSKALPSVIGFTCDIKILYRAKIQHNSIHWASLYLTTLTLGMENKGV